MGNNFSSNVTEWRHASGCLLILESVTCLYISIPAFLCLSPSHGHFAGRKRSSFLLLVVETLVGVFTAFRRGESPPSLFGEAFKNFSFLTLNVSELTTLSV